MPIECPSKNHGTSGERCAPLGRDGGEVGDHGLPTAVVSEVSDVRVGGGSLTMAAMIGRVNNVAAGVRRLGKASVPSAMFGETVDDEDAPDDRDPGLRRPTMNDQLNGARTNEHDAVGWHATSPEPVPGAGVSRKVRKNEAARARAGGEATERRELSAPWRPRPACSRRSCCPTSSARR